MHCAPAVTWTSSVKPSLPTRPGGVGQQRREAQYPPVDRHMVDLETALGAQLLDVAVRQAEAQIPADRDDDDVGREAEAGEGWARRGRRAGAVSSPTMRALT